MSWFSNLFKKKVEINPEDYGWKLEQNHHEIFHYKIEGLNCNFYLYNGFDDKRNKWTFDKDNKTGPGVLARFDGPLLHEDFLYMEEAIERINHSL